MKIIVNGKEEEVPSPVSVADLLTRLEISPALVAVERNRSVVPKRQFAACMVEDGDEIEIVTLVGGG